MALFSRKPPGNEATSPLPYSAVEVSSAALEMMRLSLSLQHRKPALKGRLRSGQHHSQHLGRGMEFSEVRHYQPGDNIRRIDWRVTARTGEAHTKLFHEEQERPVLICCDLRPQMAFATRRQFKSVSAAQTAAYLAFLSQHMKDRVGGIVATESGLSLLPPRRGDKAVARYLQALLPTAARAPGPGTDSSLSEQVQLLARITTCGFRLALISDFHDLDAALCARLRALAVHNQLLLIRISDPFERALPTGGILPLTDGRVHLRLNSHNPRTRERYAAPFAEKSTLLLELSRLERVIFLDLCTSLDLGQELPEHMELLA